MSASQWSGKEAMQGWGEPSCAGPRHVEEEVGSREWWGLTPHTLNTTLWKRNWQPQMNSTFQWIISSFGRNNPPLPSFSPLLSLLSSSLCPNATPLALFQPSKLLKLQHVWKENFSCVAFLSLPPTHLHFIKTSEITHTVFGSVKQCWSLGNIWHCISVTHFSINQCTLQVFCITFG